MGSKKSPQHSFSFTFSDRSHKWTSNRLYTHTLCTATSLTTFMKLFSSV